MREREHARKRRRLGDAFGHAGSVISAIRLLATVPSSDDREKFQSKFAPNRTLRSTARERGTRAVCLLFGVSSRMPALYGALRSGADGQARIEPAATRQKWDASARAAQQAYALLPVVRARCSCRPAQRLCAGMDRRHVLPKPKGLRSGRSRGLKVEIGLGPQRKKYRALIVRTLRLCVR
jgi:hypothetical protein